MIYEMTNKIHIKNIGELSPDSLCIDDIRKNIDCYVIDKDIIDLQFSSPIYLNAFFIILVLYGTSEIQVNYKSHEVSEGAIILLSASHLFNISSCTDDFKSLGLLVSKKFMDEMDATDMIYRRIKYGAKFYNTPVIQLGKENISALYERVSAVDKAISDKGHFYHKEMILNSLFAFYLDLSNIIERDIEPGGEGNFTRYENLIKSFIELLINNYRNEHKVEFYSSQLNITPHYLTLIVKRITGQTVNEFIYEMLYSEARNLLTHSKLSVQQITSLLHFSDQSSFGKFFKRKSGVSPLDFRKGVLFK